MGSKKKRRKRDDILGLSVGGVIGYAWLQPTYGPVVVALIGLVVLMIWFLFIMPTQCHYDLGHRGCLNPVNGWLSGCGFHGALKRDAIFAALRMQNPGLIFRVRWSDGTRSGRPIGDAGPSTSAVDAETAVKSTDVVCRG